MKPCSHPIVLPRHQAIRFKDKSERSVPLLPLYALLWSFVARSALVPLKSAVIPETMLSVDSHVVVPIQTGCHPACARFFPCSPVLGTRASCSSSVDKTLTITITKPKIHTKTNSTKQNQIRANHCKRMQTQTFKSLRMQATTKQTQETRTRSNTKHTQTKANDTTRMQGKVS